MKVAGDVKATDFVSKVVRNGASVEAGGARPRKAKKATATPAAESKAARADAGAPRTNGAGTGVAIPIAGSAGRMSAKPRGEA